MPQGAFWSSLHGDEELNLLRGALSTCSDAAPLGPSRDGKGEQGEG